MRAREEAAHAAAPSFGVALAAGAEDGRALDGTYVCTNPQTGQRFITYLYRCPECGGTNWGPCLNTPEVWCASRVRST